MKNDEQITVLMARIRTHSGLEERIEAILDIMENKSGEFITADEAEGMAIEELQKLGQELLRGWASNQQNKAIEKAEQTHPHVKRHGKKNFTGRRDLEE